jgi:hypothetical protein
VYSVILPQTTLHRQEPAPPPFGYSERVTAMSAEQYLDGLQAIDDAYVADRTALKARWPGRPSRWPAEAKRAEADIEDRRQAALDALDAAYNGQAVQS